MVKKQLFTEFSHTLRNILLGVIPVISVLMLSSCSLISGVLNPAGRQNDAQVQTEEILIPVTRGTIETVISFVGNLRYSQSAVLTWKTDGVIDKVHVKVGDHVKKNDILAELAPDSLSSSILLSEKTMIEQQEKLEDVLESASGRMQAYVNLNAKENALKQAKLEQEVLYYPRATREEMEIAWDKFALANLNFNYAKQDYDYLVSINEPWEGYEPEIWQGNRRIFGGDSRSGRERKFEDYVNTYKELVKAYENYIWISGMPTKTEYAVAQGNVAVAQMEYDQALEEYLSYNELPREKDVQQIRLSLDSAEITYKSRYILAPFDGTVTSVSAVDSYYVKKGADAMRVDDMSKIFIPLSISELDISALVNGTPVAIVVDANNGKKYSGHVYSVADSSTVSGNTTSFNAVVLIDDPDDRLLAGMTAEVSMGVNAKTGVLLIPETAVSYEEGKPFVTVVNGSERYTAEITTGIVSNGVVEVTSANIREGDLLTVPSATADVLKALGLEPSEYLSDSGQPARSFGAGQPAWIPENKPASMTEKTAEKRPENAQDQTAAGSAVTAEPTAADEPEETAGPAAASPATDNTDPDRKGPSGKRDGTEAMPKGDRQAQPGRQNPGSRGEENFRETPAGRQPEGNSTADPQETPAAGTGEQDSSR